MIKQNKIGLESRSQANPFREDGFLPLITSNMFSVVGLENYQTFLDNKINVALPRGNEYVKDKNVWNSLSINDFEEKYNNPNVDWLEDFYANILIDCANGNNPRLHLIIKKAKEIYGNRIKIMSGNISSVEAFIELAKSGCDYIRVGVGGSNSCNTSRNTGVGQTNLGKLIKQCDQAREELYIIRDVKIVADGISSYVSLCEKKYGYLDNGYAAINKLLYNGADLVMIGKLFAQCEESSGEKKHSGKIKINHNSQLAYLVDPNSSLLVKYQGMSTKEAQGNYNINLKHSEGNTSWVEVKWKLSEWLNGSIVDSDYLPGFTNCLKSAMSYVGAKHLNDFFKK
jgi:hypothetical protein